MVLILSRPEQFTEAAGHRVLPCGIIPLDWKPKSKLDDSNLLNDPHLQSQPYGLFTAALVKEVLEAQKGSCSYRPSDFVVLIGKILHHDQV